MNSAVAMWTALVAVCVGGSAPLFAQQRPLVTEDPETVGAGNLLFETGVDYARDVTFPVSGLVGNMWTIPTVGMSIGFSSIAEIQVDTAIYRGLSITERIPGPLAPLTLLDGDHTSAPDDLTIATKIRVLGETADRPALGIRLATTLPVASTESGLGKDEVDFLASFLMAKTVRSVRIVGNGGLAMLGDPTRGARQDNLLAFGASVARAVSTATELVAEVNGRVSFDGSNATPGAESRGVVRLGGRYTRASVRVDGAALLGLTSRDPDIGFTVGLTWVLKGFQIP